MSRFCCGDSARSSCRAGLTLLELVVVLGILAVLTTVAVRSLEPLADQGRYEATQRLLDTLRDAIIGSAEAHLGDGRPLITGMIADCGVLPTTPIDLLVPPEVALRQIYNFDSDRDNVNDVSLRSGWNGPYLQVGAGQTALLDGWGREPVFSFDGNTLEISCRRSDDAPGYQADLAVTIEPHRYLGDVIFRLFDIDSSSGARVPPALMGNEQLGVLFYGVNSVGAIQERLLPVAASGSFESRLSNIVHGSAAARGVLWEDANGDGQVDAGEIKRKSYVHYLTVMPVAEVRIEMELR